VMATIPVPGIWGQEIFATHDGVFVNTRDPFPGQDSTVGASRLTMIDPTKNQVGWTLADTRLVQSFQPDGVVWAQTGDTKYANEGGESLVHIEPHAGGLIGDPIPVDRNGGAFAIAPDGGVWLSGGDRSGWTIERFDPTNQIIDASVGIGEYTKDNQWWPVAVALDPVTSVVWVVHYRDNVTRIDLR
jgi:DNA-binding beta-propeller fold protein YncE